MSGTLDDSLRGRVIAVPEARELDIFAGLLTRRGAEVLRCPMLSILDAPDPAPVLAWIDDFCAGACDDLVLMTGEGLRRLLSCIAEHLPAIRPMFVSELAQTRKFARGPKPVKVLRELALSADVVANPATTAGMIEALRAAGDLRGRVVGVQLYGTEPNLPLMDFLRDAGAEVRTVAPYIYADAAADREVQNLIARLAAGTVDAIAFTSQAQVERLFKLAADCGNSAELLAGLQRTLVAAVGPVTAERLTQHGVVVDAVPQDAYFLKPLTQTLVQKLAR